MPVIARVEYRGLAAFVGNKSTRGLVGPFKQAARKALVEAGVFWRDRYLKKHFDESAYHRYQYEARESRYEALKRIRHGHNRPLVWTGKSRRMILSRRRQPRYRRSRGRDVVEVPIYAPKHFYQHSKKGGRKYINKGEELTAVTLSEIRAMARLVDRRVVEHIGRIRRVKRMRYGRRAA